ncbi:hypothetical protein KR76_00123 [Pimelobacter simplex]|uniref:Uncharacterized protein n=1 Tax=Nocardioides simplex TaxID=2045 RepID=A0A0C5XHB9_NOCSI|nr:hypothetical protein KR76_00123 [Pimelobacter simplex]
MESFEAGAPRDRPTSTSRRFGRKGQQVFGLGISRFGTSSQISEEIQ